jgi:hypothetical protein
VVKEFVPYKLRTILLELGYNYDAVCYHRADMRNKPIISEETAVRIHGSTDCLNSPAILYQQAFRWFRELGFDSSIYRARTKTKTYCWSISNFSSGFEYPKGMIGERADTYKEAELACLNKLIEIVKNKS